MVAICYKNDQNVAMMDILYRPGTPAIDDYNYMRIFRPITNEAKCERKTVDPNYVTSGDKFKLEALRASGSSIDCGLSVSRGCTSKPLGAHLSTNYP